MNISTQIIADGGIVLHAQRMHLAEEKVNIGILSDLRMDPFVNKDNLLLNDVDCVIKELIEYRELGGRTIVDPTNIGIGRNPRNHQANS